MVFRRISLSKKVEKSRRLKVKVVHADLKSFNGTTRSTVIDEYKIDLATIFITSDGRYLVHDPPITEYELEAAEREAENLIFTIPDVISSKENGLQRILISAGISDDRIVYLLSREISGYSALQPAIKDPYVEDIQIPGPDTPARIMHSIYGPLVSNIVFTDEELDKLVEKLVHLSGKSISVYQPMLSIRLPEGHRLTVTYKRDRT